MKVIPRNEYVVVSRVKVQRNAGIIVPGQETEENLTIVEAIGPGGLTSSGARAPMDGLTVGDSVFLHGGSYEQFIDGDKECLLVPQSAIIGVIEPEPTLVQ